MSDVPTWTVEEVFGDEDARYAARYRLAWMSARQRATNHLDALVEADEERDALRLAVRQFTDELGAIREGDRTLRRAVAISNEVCARLKEERDEARAEVVRLGRQVEAAQHAHDELLRREVEHSGSGREGHLNADDLRPLFDALFPKWSETS